MKLTETDFLIILTTFVILLAVLMMVLVYGIFIKKKSQLLIAQQRKEALFEQELAISQIEIKEQTLNHIGQELHDDLGQKLSVARLMTNKISFEKEQDVKKIAQEINLLVGECIQDIRNLSKVFITKQIEHFGFVDSIESEIKRIERLGLLEVDYKINNRNFDLDSDHALILFRIVQECISNVIKHSKSKIIELSVSDQRSFIEICINDKGIGFSNKHRNDGVGLKNIENRTKIINAEFSLKSIPNHGTKITVRYKKRTPWKR